MSELTNSPAMLDPSAPALKLGQLFDRSWNSVKDQLALVAGLSLVAWMGMFAAGSLPLVGWIFNAVISAGYLACLLRVRQKQNFDFADFFWAFGNMNRFLNVILAGVIVLMAIVMGTVFLIIPGLFLWIMLSLTNFILVNGDKDAVTSVKESWVLVSGNWWSVFGLMIFLGGLNILGAMCFFVGLLVTWPITYLILQEKMEDLIRIKGTGGLGAGPTTPKAPVGASSFQVNPS